MEDQLTIEQVDCLGLSEILVTLSDGCVLLLTLGQLLSAEPRVLLPDAEDDAN